MHRMKISVLFLAAGVAATLILDQLSRALEVVDVLHR